MQNLMKEVFNVLTDSTITFYQNGEEYYYSDIYNSQSCPIANLMHIGSLEDVKEMIIGLSED